MKEEKKVEAKASEKNPAQEEQSDVFSGINFSDLRVDINEMFRNGVHFGHSKSRKNPKMGEYIFATKNGINIINLEKTAEKLKEAMDFLEKIAASGQDILFVGTKKQAKKILEAAAKKCAMPYVAERWLGGTFTNFFAISSRTKYLKDGEEKMKRGEFEKYTKFERMKKSEELERMERKMGGIKNMGKFPGAIFVVSTSEDKLAIYEAKRKNIPIVALVDTNSDPDGIDYPIPANEDAVSSLKLILAYIVKSVLDGKNKKVAVADKKE